jgi:Fe2+ transport system protein FeoA
LIISEAGVAVKYNVYLRRDDILLQFRSADRSRVELTALLLRHAGVSAGVGKVDGGDSWYVVATTDKLAAGREELRKALAEIVKKARDNGWVDAGKAEQWLEKLEEGLTLMEGWPKYKVRLVKGTLEIRFGSTDPDSIEREAQRLREMGLVEGVHFTVKMPEGSGKGYVYIRREGLKHAAWLSVHASEDQRSWRQSL